LREVLANIVNERTDASPFIPMAVFKLQLMCRKQNSIVKTFKFDLMDVKQVYFLGSFTIEGGNKS
jgi:hypothetical protein